MKIIITGSLGHISLPLTKALISKGHHVVVVTSNPERQKAIESLGALAAIGSVEDVDFLSKVSTGADAIYCMTPPNFQEPDQISYYERTGLQFAAAIKKSGIKRVLYLSSYGADLPTGTGYITGSYKVEQILNHIPDISLTHIRPTSFYYNLLSFIPMIKHTGMMGSVYGENDKLALVSPLDIAAVIAEEITQLQRPLNFRYVTSDDRTCNEIAGILGMSIGLPELKWNILPTDVVMSSLISNGVPENAAWNLVELGLAIHSGILRRDYEINKPDFGKIKLEAFAKEFSASYQPIQ